MPAAGFASDSDIKSPSNTILLADSASYDTGTYSATNNLLSPSYWGSLGYSFPVVHARHQGMANLLWCDGHVKAMTPTAPTKADLFGNSPTTLKSKNLGDIMKGPYTGTWQVDDYYYELDKARSGFE